ncbi:MAG: chemotaxis protein CheW [Chloroflexi bacterium]|nr:chemotaxis protein CheW [Chloroflexota bacterium]MDA1145683.1 chemotaxis protein CheW [Chloroflexota bacterium]
MAAETSFDLAAGSRGAAVQERLLVEFALDGEGYGVDIADIREIIRYQPITVVPGTPEIVEGIINLRGRVTPIVDLRKRVGLHASEVNDATRIIVIEVDDALVGVHVDAVTGVVSLKSDQLQALSGEVTTDRSEYLEGVADVDGRLIVLINLQRALAGGADKVPAARQRERVVEQAEVVAVAAEDAPAAEAPAEEAPAGVPDASEFAGVDLGLNIELLEQSFELVKPRAEELVALFYEKLFEQHPAVVPLFDRTNMSAQRGKLLSALATVIASLRSPEALVPHLQEMGRRHVGYGAVPAHYEAVGTVLIETIGEIAGDLWSNELRDVWSDAITLVASVMIDAAAEVEPPAAKQPAASKAAEKKPAASKPAAKASSRKPAAKKAAASV